MGREIKSPFLALTVDYAAGGSITSLCDLSHDREWVIAPAATQLPRMSGDFSTTGFTGWDEMLPTIVGEGLPDHGDIWSEPWSEEEGRLEFATTATVVSPSTGLRLTRTITLHPDQPVATFRYEVVGALDEPTPFLWAAHPLFVADESTTLEVSPDVSWWRTDPLPEQPDPLPPAPLRDRAPGWTGKWWSAVDQTVSRATLKGKDGRFVTIYLGENSPLSWLGVWVDNGRFSPVPTIALEPAIGWCDDLHRAVDNGTAGYASASHPLVWEMAVACG